MERYRSRNFCAVLYPDDPTHVEALQRIVRNGWDFAYVLHDRDPKDDGDGFKKSHWHLVLKFRNAVWNTNLASQLGIAENYLEACRNLDSALLYLIHYGCEDKAEYDPDGVFGSLKIRLQSLLSDDDENTRAMTIFRMIHEADGIITYSEIFKKACEAGLYGDFRRMGSGVIALIRDHNDAYLHDIDVFNAEFRGYVKGHSDRNNIKLFY